MHANKNAAVKLIIIVVKMILELLQKL